MFSSEDLSEDVSCRVRHAVPEGGGVLRGTCATSVGDDQDIRWDDMRTYSEIFLDGRTLPNDTYYKVHDDGRRTAANFLFVQSQIMTRYPGSCFWKNTHELLQRDVTPLTLSL